MPGKRSTNFPGKTAGSNGLIPKQVRFTRRADMYSKT